MASSKPLVLFLNYLLIIMVSMHLIVIKVHGDNTFTSSERRVLEDKHYDHGINHVRKMQAFKELIVASPSPLASPSPASAPPPGQTRNAMVYHVTTYGADPTGKSDSTEALLRVFTEIGNSKNNNNGNLMDGITNLGGVTINLDGGTYVINRPLHFPTPYLGNILIHGGTLKASDNFPTNGYLIELSASSSTQNQEKTTSADQLLSSNSASYNFEYITLRDLMLDCNYKGGGITITNSLRIGVDNCYIAHFMTEGIRVDSGHETLIRNSFIGQHITAGSDPGERRFNGTGIILNGNDNVVTDVVIFSAQIGIMVSGQANLLSGVHCYNKAYGFGGTGIYLKLPGLTQTRIVNSYLDYTGIVVEDPFQLVISNNFFLGDAFIQFKSIKGIANGVNIVDNLFSGSGKGIDIVQLDGSFGNVDQVVIDRNSANGMNLKSTIARAAVEGNAASWTADFNRVLLFPNLIKHVQYTLSTSGNSFPNYALRNVSDNRVVIKSNIVAPTNVYVTVEQGSN